MIGWITSVFELLGPIHKALEHEICTSGCLHVDETTLRVQRGEKDKLGVGKASTDYLWAMLGRGPAAVRAGSMYSARVSASFMVTEYFLRKLCV